MNNEMIRYAYGSGLYRRGDQVILAGAPLFESEHQKFDSMTRSMVELVLYAFKNRHQANHSKLARALGKSSSLLNLLLSLSPETLSSSILARADIVRTAENFKLIELNLGSQIGGMYYASLPRLAGFTQAYDALAGWTEQILSQLKNSDSMVFTDSMAATTWMSPYCQHLSRELALHTGLDTPLVDCESFSYRNGRLYAAGREVSKVYSWLSDNDLYEGRERMHPLIQALQEGIAELIMSPLAPIFANKGFFAELWRMQEENSLDDEQSAFMKAHVPFTQWLEFADYDWLSGEQQSLVIKPSDGYGGHGVLVGSEMSAQAWKASINECLHQTETRYVIQVLARPLCQSVRVGRWDGSFKWEDSHVIWGSFVQGGKYLGAYARSKPSTDSLVINQGNGAAVGPVTVW